MQLIDVIQLTLSNDNGTNPQSVVKKENTSNTDTALLTELVEFKQPFPVATTALAMGTIAQGRWIYVKPTSDVSLLFNGGAEPIQFRGGKVSRMWINFTAVSVVVSGAPNVVEIVIAGE